MALEITQTVRRAIENGEPLKASDVLALAPRAIRFGRSLLIGLLSARGRSEGNICKNIWSVIDRLNVKPPNSKPPTRILRLSTKP